MYWIKTPIWLSKIFKKRVWHMDASSKVIYLTFDDGPTPKVTSFVLDCLREYNAKATFFCIGNNIQKHPRLFNQLMEEGHSVGNHTFSHHNGWKTPTEDYVKDSILAETYLYSDKIPEAKLFRPPYGKCTKKQRTQLRKRGYKIIMWSVLSADFDTNVTKESCLNNVLKNTTNGSIIVFHDSVKVEEKIRFVLPKVLNHFGNQGYQFKDIDPLKL